MKISILSALGLFVAVSVASIDLTHDHQKTTIGEDGNTMIEEEDTPEDEDDAPPPTQPPMPQKKCNCKQTGTEPFSQPAMAWQALEELLDVIKDVGPITGPAVPVYRLDLPDYIAYWSFEVNSTDYVVISAGPKTGDYKLAAQGPLPSMISELDMTAGSYKKSCSRYYMLSTDGEMLCKDAKGNIVATTAEEDLVKGDDSNDDDDPNYETAHAYLSKNLCNLRVEWVKRAYEVASKGIWDKEEADDEDDDDDIPSFHEGDDAKEQFFEEYVEPGAKIRLPIDAHTKSIRAMYVRAENEETTTYVHMMQRKLCQVLSRCDHVNMVSIDISTPEQLFGYKYIEVKIDEGARDILNGTSIDFEIQTEIDNGPIEMKRFSLQCPPRRQKRFKEYTWGGWNYRSIGYESYFPDYQQHKFKKGRKTCSVGCGPVAWAMIFGYYDRRSHYKSSVYGSGSRGLYRCGSDGSSGSYNCVAPKYATTTRIKKYIETLNKVLGTWCIFSHGATPVFKMDNVKGFFQARQKSGSPTLKETNNIWRLIARSAYAKQTRSWISSGWPVVVGTTEGGVFKWHYPVATRYRYRHGKYRRCIKIFRKKICFKWHSTTGYQMYTHQGWGRGSVKWRAMSIHYAAIVPY